MREREMEKERVREEKNSSEFGVKGGVNKEGGHRKINVKDKERRGCR